MQVLLIAHIQERLVEELRRRVRNGETTERALAKQTGISQPHIHNVLKGQRLLSSELADAVLTTLQLSVLDLFDRQQMTTFLNRQANLEVRVVAVPVLEGLLGPGYPLPRQVLAPEMYTVPGEQAALATQPMVARLAADPAMAELFGEGDLVLLDQSETLRTSPQPQGYYVVNTPTGALVRAIRREGEALCLWSGSKEAKPEARETWIPLAGLDVLGLVLARVVWLNQRRRWSDLPAGA